MLAAVSIPSDIIFPCTPCTTLVCMNEKASHHICFAPGYMQSTIPSPIRTLSALIASLLLSFSVPHRLHTFISFMYFGPPHLMHVSVPPRQQ